MSCDCNWICVARWRVDFAVELFLAETFHFALHGNKRQIKNRFSSTCTTIGRWQWHQRQTITNDREWERNDYHGAFLNKRHYRLLHTNLIDCAAWTSVCSYRVYDISVDAIFGSMYLVFECSAHVIIINKTLSDYWFSLHFFFILITASISSFTTFTLFEGKKNMRTD